jgi:hypothetical protein
MPSDMMPVLLYGLTTKEGLRCIDDQCIILHNLHQLVLPNFVARKVDGNPGYLLLPGADIEYLWRLLR